jgi:hypothetical protein
MLVGSLSVDGVEIQKMKIPENAKEVRYGQYLDYALMKSDIDKWLLIQMEKGRDYHSQYRIKLAHAYATFFDIKPSTLARIQKDGVEFLESAGSLINKVVTDFKPVDNDGVFRITDPSNSQVTEYKIPEINKAVFRGTNNLPTLTFQQLTEIAEADRILQDQIERIDKDINETKDFKGTLISKAMQKSYAVFENTIKKIVLCVNNIKDIPVDDTFDMWVETEMKKFRNISMYDALNTIFFLKGIPLKYGMSIDLGSISNVLRLHSIAMNQTNNTQNASEILKLEASEYTIS